MTIDQVANANAGSLERTQGISQAEIERLRELQARNREYRQLRSSIVERLAAGAATEEGRLAVRIEEKRLRQISRSALIGIWGDEYVENLRQNLPETVQRHLKVMDQSNLADM